MSSWATPKLRKKCKDFRLDEKKQIGMVLTHDKKGKLLKYRFRYKINELKK